MMYFHGLKGGFVFDDQFLIVETIGSLTPHSIWLGGLWGEGSNQANSYRPLFSMTIWLDQQLFGLKPSGYHLHSLMWHMLNIWLFSLFATQVLSKRQVMVATFVFGCHPLMSELVYWIAARNDTMAMTFALLFLNLFWQKRGEHLSWRSMTIMSGIFLAGLLSKESVLILFVPVGWHAFKHRTFKLLESCS